MSRFEEAELALVEKLRALDLSPDMTVNMFNIEDPLNAVGFSQDEIMAVLQALEQDRIVEFVPGNRVRQLKPLP
jgi:flagellar basal body P-ring protein FlgI